ncbi:maintenance of mitochondrial structure and function-domain-containing protein [Chytridium lagenaria]|nr:maintenance of mitochondrial structure and function-domain-containing protein [Chytridium lagenaria]
MVLETQQQRVNENKQSLKACKKTNTKPNITASYTSSSPPSLQRSHTIDSLEPTSQRNATLRCNARLCGHPPLVLLSKRVVGILLGQSVGNVVNVANSYAGRRKDPSVWFLDHNYHEAMYDMFKKVNAKEKMVGWYHTGPKLRSSDLEINELFKRYNPNPVLVIIDVKPKDLGLPTDAYFAVEEVHDAEEAEEIGVEHLLRDIKDNAVGTLSTQITDQLNSLKGLGIRLEEIQEYLTKVVDDIFNLLPNLNVPDSVRAFAVKSNDELLVIYLSSLIRAVIALHNLITNKISNSEAERKENKDEEEKPVATAEEKAKKGVKEEKADEKK